MKTKLICLILFIMAVIVVRILDFTMMWNYMSSDYFKYNISYFGRHAYNMEKDINDGNKNEKTISLKPNQKIFFKEIGFSSYSKAKIILNELDRAREEKIVVVSYFDLFCPLVYLIKNKGEKVELGYEDIGALEIDKGFMEIIFNKGENCRIISNNKEKSFFIIAILGDDTQCESSHFLTTMHGTSSFTPKVFFLYFYLPLIIILFLSIKIDKSFFISYFYFYEMILFFGLTTPFISLSNSFLDKIFKVKSLSIYWGYFLLVLISVLFIYGIYYKRKKKNDSLSPFIRNTVITFFIFLPFVLRFSHLSLEWLFKLLSRVF